MIADPKLAEEYQTMAELQEALAEADQKLLAVKPFLDQGLAKELGNRMSKLWAVFNPLARNLALRVTEHEEGLRQFILEPTPVESEDWEWQEVGR